VLWPRDEALKRDGTMKRTLLAAVVAIAIAAVAMAQELPDYPIEDQDDQRYYDYLAAEWGTYKDADQCALDRMKERHITRTYENLLSAWSSCLLKEDHEKE
jgi:hypothetical protein